MGDPAAFPLELEPFPLGASNDPEVMIVGLPLVVELKLEILPLRSSFDLGSFRLAPREGVERPPGAATSIGEEVDVDVGELGPSARDVVVVMVLSEMEVVLRLSARSLVDSSFDRVRPIFLDGVWPILRVCSDLARRQR